jgi:hypothetical protein
VVRVLLIGTLVLVTLAITWVSLGLYHAWVAAAGWLPIDRLNFFLDAYKAIGIGFLIAIVSVLIPYYVQEVRDKLSRFKESRVQYSQAKTSVMYLRETITLIDDVKKAVAAVRFAHKKLHLAETYREELRHHLSWHRHPETWVDRNYWELVAIRKVLDANLQRWESMTREARLKTLDHALGIVHSHFGFYNDNDLWWMRDRKERETSIHDELKKIYDQT